LFFAYGTKLSNDQNQYVKLLTLTRFVQFNYGNGFKYKTDRIRQTIPHINDSTRKTFTTTSYKLFVRMP